MKSFTGFGEYLQRGDVVAWGTAAGEPQTLVEQLLAEGACTPGLSLFVWLSVSGLLTPDRLKPFRVLAGGGFGLLSQFAREGGDLRVIPMNLSDIPRLVETGVLPVSVVLVQISPPNRHGYCSLGVTTDFIHTLVKHARVVIAEINPRMPHTWGAAALPVSKIMAALEVDRPLVSSPPPRVGATEGAIAKNIADLVPDGATIQLGYGSLPQAVLDALGGKNDLGLHSGMITDGVATLIERGVLTNARKPIDVGRSVTGVVLGTERLYTFVDDNPLVEMRECTYTHGATVLSQLPDFVAINSSVEVDLWGQVNAELAGDRLIGGVGGQLDFVRGAHLAPRGKSILALPSTARDGKVSRIVPQLRSAAVTYGKSDADWVVTEFGAARLQGLPLEARAQALIDLAHPDFRDSLREAAQHLTRRTALA